MTLVGACTSGGVLHIPPKPLYYRTQNQHPVSFILAKPTNFFKPLITVNNAAELIKGGGIVAFPTETVYGLGADAWDPTAVQKIFDIKGRPPDNPLIVHIASKTMVNDFAEEVPGDARILMDVFWPGPLTLIFRKKPEVLDIVTGGMDTVALRWPGHPLSQELIALSGPLVAPSANTSGRPSPTRPEHVKEDFGDDFPVIEAGETQIGLESTVLDLTTEPHTIYRPGYIGKDELEVALGKNITVSPAGDNSDQKRSPGTRYSHYAPEAKVSWLNSGRDEITPRGDALFLLHFKKYTATGKNIIRYKGNYERFARELYDRFRQADHEKYDFVYVEPFSKAQLEKKPLVRALKNRIDKASGQVT